MGTHVDAATSNYRSKSGMNSGQISGKHETTSFTIAKN